MSTIFARARSGLVTACALALVAACGQVSGSEVVSMDQPDFATVDALAKNSDAVVIGVIGDVVARERDGGGNPEISDEGRAVGLPMVFRSMSVTRVVGGNAPSRLVVGWIDIDVVTLTDPLSRLEAGQKVVLFLRHRAPGQAPGVADVSDFWVPISGDNGVMDVTASGYRARGAVLTGLTPGALAQRGPLVITDEQLTSVVGMSAGS